MPYLVTLQISECFMVINKVCNTFLHCDDIYILIYYCDKGSFGVMIKLLPYDLKVTGSNRGNILLQCSVRLCIIDSSLELRISRSFMHQTHFITIAQK